MNTISAPVHSLFPDGSARAAIKVLRWIGAVALRPVCFVGNAAAASVRGWIGFFGYHLERFIELAVSLLLIIGVAQIARWLALHLSGWLSMGEVFPNLIALGVSLFIVIFGVTWLGAMWAYRRTQRLKGIESDYLKIGQMVEHYARGDLRWRIGDLNDAQARSVGNHVNQFADCVESTVGALNSRDANRCDLIAQVVHDLLKPVASLKVQLDLLIQKGVASDLDHAAEHLGTLQRNMRSIDTLMSQFLELSRYDLTTFRPAIERFSADELAGDIVACTLALARERGVQLTIAREAAAYSTRADPLLIERAIRNVLDNALSFTPSGGSITVTLRHSRSGTIVISIRDTGCGIKATELARLSTPLFRGSNTRIGEAQGNGLGLAITRRICELHGTALRIASTEGRGTEVSFELPLVAGD